MEKVICSYDVETGIVINCTQISEGEHRIACKEVKDLGFNFETIDAGSFWAKLEGDHLADTLDELDQLGYSF